MYVWDATCSHIRFWFTDQLTVVAEHAVGSLKDILLKVWGKVSRQSLRAEKD